MADIAPTHAVALLVVMVCVLGVVWIAHRLDSRARRRKAEHRAERARRAAEQLQASTRRLDTRSIPGEAMAEHQARLARLRLVRAQAALREDPMRRHTTSPCVIAPASMAEPLRPTAIGDITAPTHQRRNLATTAAAED